MVSSCFLGYHLAHRRLTPWISSAIPISPSPRQEETRCPASLWTSFSHSGCASPATLRMSPCLCSPGSQAGSCGTASGSRSSDTSRCSPAPLPHQSPSGVDTRPPSPPLPSLRLLPRFWSPSCLPPYADRTQSRVRGDPCMRLLSPDAPRRSTLTSFSGLIDIGGARP